VVSRALGNFALFLQVHPLHFNESSIQNKRERRKILIFSLLHPLSRLLGV